MGTGTRTLGKDVESRRDGVVSPTTRRGGVGLRGSTAGGLLKMTSHAPRRPWPLPRDGTLLESWRAGSNIGRVGGGQSAVIRPSGPVAPRKEMLRGTYSFFRRGSRVEGMGCLRTRGCASKPVVGRRVGGGRLLPPTSRDRESGTAAEKQAWRRHRSPEQWRPGAAGPGGVAGPRAFGTRRQASPTLSSKQMLEKRPSSSWP